MVNRDKGDCVDMKGTAIQQCILSIGGVSFILQMESVNVFVSTKGRFYAKLSLVLLKGKAQCIVLRVAWLLNYEYNFCIPGSAMLPMHCLALHDSCILRTAGVRVG